MKILTFLIFILISFQLLGQTKSYHQGTQSYQLHLHQNLWVSEDCLKECLALKTPQLKRASNLIHAGNPAAEFCKSAQGKYLAVKDPTGLAEGLCQFSDGSYILAWDYFKKFKNK